MFAETGQTKENQPRNFLLHIKQNIKLPIFYIIFGLIRKLYNIKDMNHTVNRGGVKNLIQKINHPILDLITSKPLPKEIVQSFSLLLPLV